MSASNSFSRWYQLVETLSSSPCRKTECTWSLSQLWRNSAVREKRPSLVIEEIGREKKKSCLDTDAELRHQAMSGLQPGTASCNHSNIPSFFFTFHSLWPSLLWKQPSLMLVLMLCHGSLHPAYPFVSFFFYFSDRVYSDSLSSWGGLGRNISKIASQHTKAVRHLHIVRTV